MSSTSVDVAARSPGPLASFVDPTADNGYGALCLVIVFLFLYLVDTKRKLNQSEKRNAEKQNTEERKLEPANDARRPTSSSLPRASRWSSSALRDRKKSASARSQRRRTSPESDDDSGYSSGDAQARSTRRRSKASGSGRPAAQSRSRAQQESEDEAEEGDYVPEESDNALHGSDESEEVGEGSETSMMSSSAHAPQLTSRTSHRVVLLPQYQSPQESDDDENVLGLSSDDESTVPHPAPPTALPNPNSGVDVLPSILPHPALPIALPNPNPGVDVPAIGTIPRERGRKVNGLEITGADEVHPWYFLSTGSTELRQPAGNHAQAQEHDIYIHEVTTTLKRYVQVWFRIEGKWEEKKVGSQCCHPEMGRYHLKITTDLKVLWVVETTYDNWKGPSSAFKVTRSN
ncbi:hypothetical protein PLICRDRAFT_30040 [Plicaturopsis crispa FD-325 SS-3]|nr:hypothetical protein PLICRDRAFT_30040 [Plicaturopsis crispa FD-325 SS-3]